MYLAEGIPNKESFVEQLFRRTGIEGHVSKVFKKIKGPIPVSSETAI
jgi:hypothetical protein